jgi:hypothetical protein
MCSVRISFGFRLKYIQHPLNHFGHPENEGSELLPILENIKPLHGADTQRRPI